MITNLTIFENGVVMFRLKKKCIGSGGFTLVELIVAIAVAGAVMGAIVFFMNISLNQYRTVNADVTLQMEAQAAIDYIGEFMMEAKYTPVKVDCEGYDAYVVEVPDIGVDIDEKNKVSATRESTAILMLFDSSKKRLYAVSNPDFKDLSKVSDTLSKVSNLDDSMIAERVSAFTLDPYLEFDKAYDENGRVKILSNMEKVSVTLSFDNKSKRVESEFRLRNAR